MAEGRLDQWMFVTSKTFICLMQDHVKHTHLQSQTLHISQDLYIISTSMDVDKRPHPHCQG